MLKGWCSTYTYLLVVKNLVLILLRVLSLKRSRARAFVVPFRALSQKYVTSLCVDLEFVPLRGENILSHATKRDIGTSWASFQTFQQAVPFFLYGSVPQGFPSD